MASDYKIFWTDEAINNLGDILDYLNNKLHIHSITCKKGSDDIVMELHFYHIDTKKQTKLSMNKPYFQFINLSSYMKPTHKPYLPYSFNVF
jgi:hypothetical protein